jgi:YD repeat-containing protein
MKSFISVLLITLTFVLFVEGCGERGNEKYYRKVDIDGKYSIIGRYPISREMGMKGESYRFVYDKEENLKKVEHLVGGMLKGESFFGKDVAGVKIDNMLMQEKRSYYNIEGLPCTGKMGVNFIRLPFDENEYLKEKLNCDVTGEFIEDSYGVTQYIWFLDDRGRRIKTKFYNYVGKQIAGNDEVFERRLKYDEDGNMIERRYLDSKGRLKEDANGFAVLRQQFDPNGNVIETRYFDSDDELTEMKNGAVIVNTEYDDNGNPVEVRYLGKDGKLAENNMGVAIVKSEFDSYCNIKERRYYDADKKLTEGTFYGFAIMQWEYDEKGRMIETRFLDVDGELENALNEEAAIMRIKYDEYGNIEQVLRFNKEEELLEDTTSVSGEN